MESKNLVFPLAENMTHNNGLTKREYFAALAMQSFIQTNEFVGLNTNNYERISQACVKMADALLIELDRSEVENE